MFNEVLILGKLITMPERIPDRNGNPYYQIKIEVKRLFKNSHGFFDSDFIPVILWKGIADTLTDVSKVGDMISVKGRLESNPAIYGNDSPLMSVVAEKIDYLQKYV